MRALIFHEQFKESKTIEMPIEDGQLDYEQVKEVLNKAIRHR